MSTTSRADYLKHWEELLLALDNHAPWPMTRMEENRDALATVCDQLKATSAEQAVHKARMQQTTRDIEELVRSGKMVATEVHDMLRGIYGRQAEALVEFRLQPRRSRTPPAQRPGNLLTLEGSTKETPPEPDGDPARTATPGTDGST